MAKSSATMAAASKDAATDSEAVAEQNTKMLERILGRVLHSARLTKVLELIDMVIDPPVAKDGPWASLIKLGQLLVVLLFLLVLGWLFGVFLTWGTILVVCLVHLSAKNVKSDETFYRHLFHLFASQEQLQVSDEKQACEWLNYMMDKFWNSVVEEIVLGIVPTIHKTMEGMEALDMLGMRIKIKEISLGRTSPRLLFMGVERTKRHDSIVLKTETVFASNDMRMVIDVKTPAVNMPVLVTNFKFRAPVRIEVKLNADDLMASIVSVSLMKDPDFTCPTVRPMKGLNVMMIPGLPQIVQGIVKDICHDMFVYPQMFRMTFGAEMIEGPMPTDTPITDIAIIHAGKEEVPEGWTVLQRSSSLQYKADLNTGAGRSRELYICYKRSKHEAPITDIAVTFPNGNEDVCTDDYVLKSRSVTGAETGNMNRGGNKKALLAYKKDPLAPPITDLSVVLAAKDNECVLPGYRKIEWSLNGRTLADLNGEQCPDQIFLTYKGGRSPNRHDHVQPISEVNLIYQDKGETPLPGHATIYRTVSSQFNADTNKGSHGRTIYATYKRASLVDDDKVISDLILVHTAQGEDTVVPPGYEIVRTSGAGNVADLNCGTGYGVIQYAIKTTHIRNTVDQAIRVNGRVAGDDELVLTGICVINGSSDIEGVPDGFTMLPVGLNHRNKKGRKMIMCVRRTPLHELVAPLLKPQLGDAPVDEASIGVLVDPIGGVTPGEPDSPGTSAEQRSPARASSFSVPPPARPVSQVKPEVPRAPAKPPITKVGCFVQGREELPSGWEVIRHTATGQYEANCNAGSGGDQVFVCVRRDLGEDPVTAVGVLFRMRAHKLTKKNGRSGEVTPPNWVEVDTSVGGKMSGDFNKGSGGRDVYLTYSTKERAEPITDLAIIFADLGEKPPPYMKVLYKTISGVCDADMNSESGKGDFAGKGRVVHLCYAGGGTPVCRPGAWKDV